MATRSPAPADLRRLKLSPEVAWYLTDRGYRLPDRPPAVKTPEPRRVRGSRFDPERVDRVISVFRRLRHTQGRWAGRPLEPDVWQVAYILAPVFGWVRPDDDEPGAWVRIIRKLYVDVPRKNGKTTTAGGLAVTLLAADDEPGAQVIAAAGAERQARYCFDPVKQIATKSPDLSPYVKPLASRIVHVPSSSYFEVVSKAADLLHGANVHGAIIDELHVHKTADTVEAIETGTGSRRQPLIVTITTADDGKPGTVYARRRHYVEQVASGVIADPTMYGVIWAAGKDDDPWAEATWEKANPGYPVSPTRSFMQSAAAEARQSPADLAKFLRLHLGIRTKQTTKYVTLSEWSRNAGMVIPEQMAGRRAYGGLDLSATTDMTALCWLLPDDDGGFDVLWRLWLPEAAFEALDRRTAREATVWRRDGWLTVTNGNVMDYGWARTQIEQDMDRYDVRAVGFDPWNATQLTVELAEMGAPMQEVRQGYASLSAPLKECKRLLAEGSAVRPMLRHGGNPVMFWQTDNLAVTMDPSGNVKPDKSTAADRIDGWAALVTAMSRAMVAKPKPSVYEGRGVLFLGGAS